jgi:hypothetical protein
MTDIKQYFTFKKITEASAVMVMNPTNYITKVDRNVHLGFLILNKYVI